MSRFEWERCRDGGACVALLRVGRFCGSASGRADGSCTDSLSGVLATGGSSGTASGLIELFEACIAPYCVLDPIFYLSTFSQPSPPSSSLSLASFLFSSSFRNSGDFIYSICDLDNGGSLPLTTAFECHFCEAVGVDEGESGV